MPLEPEAIKGVRNLNTRDGLHNEVLIKWKATPHHDSTWEDFENVWLNFPHFDLEDKFKI